MACCSNKSQHDSSLDESGEKADVFDGLFRRRVIGNEKTTKITKQLTKALKDSDDDFERDMDYDKNEIPDTLSQCI